MLIKNNIFALALSFSLLHSISLETLNFQNYRPLAKGLSALLCTVFIKDCIKNYALSKKIIPYILKKRAQGAPIENMQKINGFLFNKNDGTSKTAVIFGLTAGPIIDNIVIEKSDSFLYNYFGNYTKFLKYYREFTYTSKIIMYYIKTSRMPLALSLSTLLNSFNVINFGIKYVFIKAFNKKLSPINTLITGVITKILLQIMCCRIEKNIYESSKKPLPSLYKFLRASLFLFPGSEITKYDSQFVEKLDNQEKIFLKFIKISYIDCIRKNASLI